MTAPFDADELLARYVAQFKRRYPRVQLDVSFSSRHMDLVAEGYDLALRAGVLKDSTLVVRKVLQTDLVLVAAPTYLRRHGTPKAVAELAAHACIGMSGGTGRGVWALSADDGREESVEVQFTVMTDLLQFAVRSALEGVGIALVPQVIAVGLAQPRALVHVLPRWRVVGGGLSVVSPSRAFEPLAVKLFKEGLIDELTKLSARRCRKAARRRAA